MFYKRLSDLYVFNCGGLNLRSRGSLQCSFRWLALLIRFSCENNKVATISEGVENTLAIQIKTPSCKLEAGLSAYIRRPLATIATKQHSGAINQSRVKILVMKASIAVAYTNGHGPMCVFKTASSTNVNAKEHPIEAIRMMNAKRRRTIGFAFVCVWAGEA